MQIEKARESLRAAEMCFDEKMYNSTVNRAYYAMFQAAVFALERMSIRPKGEQWSHEQMRATFGMELTRNRKLYPQHFVTNLADALHARNRADYEQIMATERQARKLLRWAREFLLAIDRGNT